MSAIITHKKYWGHKTNMGNYRKHTTRKINHSFYCEIRLIAHDPQMESAQPFTIIVHADDKPYITRNCTIKVLGIFANNMLRYKEIIETSHIHEDDAYRLLHDQVYQKPIVKQIFIKNNEILVNTMHDGSFMSLVFSNAEIAYNKLTRGNRFIINKADLLLLQEQMKKKQITKKSLLPPIPLKLNKEVKKNHIFIDNADQFDTISWIFENQKANTYSTSEGIDYSAFVSGSILIVGKKRGHEQTDKTIKILNPFRQKPAEKTEKRQIPETNDLKGFEQKYRSYHESLFPLERKDVYVGLDFGTSFTKVAYHLDNMNKGVVSFGESFFKPSVVYLSKEKSLSLFRTEPGDRQIRFFKATMITDKKVYSELRYADLEITDSENFEFLCSVLFLANIIRYTKQYLSEKFNCHPNLFISMGIPMSKTDKDVEIYNKAFHVAIALAEYPKEIDTLSLSELNSIFKEKVASFNSADYNAQQEGFINCTMPELFTEALYMVQRRDFDEGLYLIIDIGGGTTDYALIKKEAEDARSMQFRYYCPSAVVAHLGNEVREACSDINAQTVYADQFAWMYLSTIGLAKNEDDSIRPPFEVTQILFGGGAALANNYYQTLCSPNHKCQSSIRQIGCSMKTKDQNKYENPFLSKEDNQRISPSERQRLIIACQLANPESRTAFLRGFPKDYSSLKESTNEDTKTYFEKVREALGYEPSWF